MYETIMDLPLFKGVGKDHVSQFLEKTPVSFHNYTDGELISTPGEEVKMIKFIIKGEVDICNTLESLDLTVVERSGTGRVLGDSEKSVCSKHTSCAATFNHCKIKRFKRITYVHLSLNDKFYHLYLFSGR